MEKEIEFAEKEESHIPWSMLPYPTIPRKKENPRGSGSSVRLP